jgi:hypothetical protein
MCRDDSLNGVVVVDPGRREGGLDVTGSHALTDGRVVDPTVPQQRDRERPESSV